MAIRHQGSRSATRQTDSVKDDDSLYPLVTDLCVSSRRAAPAASRVSLAPRACGLWLAWLIAALFVFATAPARAEIEFAPPDNLATPIQIQAATGQRWTEGAYDVWSLAGDCQITQGTTRITGREAVLWIERGGSLGSPPWRMIVYVEGEVTLLRGPQSTENGNAPSAKTTTLQPSDSQRAPSWLGRLSSALEPQIRLQRPGAVLAAPLNGTAQPNAALAATPQERPPVYARAWQRLAPQGSARLVGYSSLNPGPAGVQRADGSGLPGGGKSAAPLSAAANAAAANPIKRTQYAEYSGDPARIPPPAVVSPTVSQRRIQIFPRSGVPLQADYLPSPGGQETVVTINSGVQVRIDGLASDMPGVGNVGTLDISADKVVIWYQGSLGDLGSGGTQRGDAPLEIYMEGDIIFREGDRVIYAQAMYYNVPQSNGVILNAEIVTPVKSYAGLVRLRANVIRQLDEARFTAEGASLTTSRLAAPSYEFRAGQLTLTDIQTPLVNPQTGLPAINPATGEILNDHTQLVTSANNVVFADGVPVFYWPRLVTDLEQPTFFVKDIRVGNDQVFGTQGAVTFDPYQLFGWTKPPPQTDWDLDLGYMSERGFNAGTRFNYSRDLLFGQTAPVYGLFDAFYVNEQGLDTLGVDRVAMIPEADQRFRVLGKHRQLFDNGWQVSAELGIISDRNFLEQYLEREWDDQKDQLSGIELKRYFDNQSFSIALDYTPNDFFLRTQQLPRLDYFAIGESLWEDRLTTYGHITGGYTQQQIASTPTAPQDAATFAPLPYEVDTSGERLAWRQALEYPIPIAGVKLVPFALGEAADWGEDLSGDATQRLYGQAGVRTSLPFWGLYPEYESELLNVHGVAHKMNFDLEYSYTDSNRNVDELALYDEIDDDAQQHFRRRLAFLDYGGPAPVPAKFDERFYGVRRGLQDNVTGPTEIVDDLQVARLGLRQRWQTKRGPEANRRIIDWVVFDTQFEIFPDEHDNFGENAGLLDYDFRWHVGDRVTLLSSGAADFFGDGQRYFSAGAQLSRPTRGNIYVGFRSFEGPISSNILLASLNYRMSAKWVGTAGVSFDLSSKGYLGETFSLTRIGESFLMTAAFTADQTRDNIGATFFLEPRFLPRTRFGRRTGIDVPLAGQFGVE